MFARKTLFYISVNQIQQILGFITSFAIRRFIAPFDFGIWTTIKMIVRYSEFTNLGIFSAAAKEIPYYVGKKDFERATLIKNVTGTFVFLVLFIASGALFFGSFILQLSPKLQVGLRVSSIIFLLTFVYSFYINLLRAYNNFNGLSKVIFANSLLVFFCYIPLSYFMGLNGLYIAVILSLFGTIVYVWYANREIARFRFITAKEELKELFPLLKIGIGLFIVGTCSILFLTSEKWIIATFLGFEHLGYYSIAILTSSAISAIPRLVSHISFTEMQNTYGEKDKTHYALEGIKKYVSELTLYTAYIMPVVIGLAFIWGGWLVNLLIPRYSPGITCMYIILGASFFYGLSHFSYNLLITLNKYIVLIPLFLFCTATIFVSSIFFIRQGLGIEGVAYSVLVGYFLFFVAVSWASWKNIHSAGEIGIIYIKIALTILYYTIIIFLCNKIRFSSELLTMFAKTIVFMVGAIPIAIKVEGRINVIRKMLRKET